MCWLPGGPGLPGNPFLPFPPSNPTTPASPLSPVGPGGPAEQNVKHIRQRHQLKVWIYPVKRIPSKCLSILGDPSLQTFMEYSGERGNRP